METKQCGTCKQHLSAECFYRLKPMQPTHSWRLSTECKECKKARGAKHYVENTERHKRALKLRFDTFGRFAKYGLTRERYEEMLAGQSGCCALCKSQSPGGKGKWHIDHAGGTNNKINRQCNADAVRGLLCHRCNVSLGHYEKLINRVGEQAVTRYLHLKE